LSLLLLADVMCNMYYSVHMLSCFFKNLSLYVEPPQKRLHFCPFILSLSFDQNTLNTSKIPRCSPRIRTHFTPPRRCRSDLASAPRKEQFIRARRGKKVWAHREECRSSKRTKRRAMKSKCSKKCSNSPNEGKRTRKRKTRAFQREKKAMDLGTKVRLKSGFWRRFLNPILLLL